MEEIIQIDGRIRNASFTDYLLPTMLDMPRSSMSLVEEYEPLAPLGAKGVGEPPCISSTPAIVAAIATPCQPAGPRPATSTGSRPLRSTSWTLCFGVFRCALRYAVACNACPMSVRS